MGLAGFVISIDALKRRLVRLFRLVMRLLLVVLVGHGRVTADSHHQGGEHSGALG